MTGVLGPSEVAANDAAWHCVLDVVVPAGMATFKGWAMLNVSKSIRIWQMSAEHLQTW